MPIESQKPGPGPDVYSHSLVWYVNWLALVLGLYVLSTGPVAWLEQHGRLLSGFHDWLYKPLHVVYNRYTPLAGFLDWYECKFWMIDRSMDHPVPTAFGIE